MICTKQIIDQRGSLRSIHFDLLALKAAHRAFAVARMFHPFMPFVTEASWQNFGKPGMLITAAFPTLDAERESQEESQDIA